MNPLLIKVLAGVAVMAALYGGYKAVTSHYVAKGRAEVQASWDADKEARKAAEIVAVNERLASNELERRAISERNEELEHAYNEELSKVRSELATAKRLRVGTAICGRSASPANTKSAPGGVEADTGGGLVREDVERDIRALELRVEEALATGRVCQGFVRANSLM